MEEGRRHSIASAAAVKIMIKSGWIATIAIVILAEFTLLGRFVREGPDAGSTWILYVGMIGICAGTIWILIVLSNRKTAAPFWGLVFSPVGTGQLAGGVVLILWRAQVRTIWVQIAISVMISTLIIGLFDRHGRAKRQRRNSR